MQRISWQGSGALIDRCSQLRACLAFRVELRLHHESKTSARIAIHRAAVSCQSKDVVTLAVRNTRAKVKPPPPFPPPVISITVRFMKLQAEYMRRTKKWRRPRERRQGRAGGVAPVQLFFMRRCRACPFAAASPARQRSVAPVRQHPDVANPAPPRGIARSRAA